MTAFLESVLSIYAFLLLAGANACQDAAARGRLRSSLGHGLKTPEAWLGSGPARLVPPAGSGRFPGHIPGNRWQVREAFGIPVLAQWGRNALT